MLVKITTYNNTVYKFASKTTDTSDGIYLGRLRDDLSLTSMASASGTVPASQNLTIYNADNYIPKSVNFWGASLLLTQDNGLTWLGKVTFFNFDSDGNLYLTASEKGAPELELQLPDEVRQVYTVDDNFHQSSTTMTIPLAIGGSTSNPLLLPTILIDKTQGIYLICVGEIRSILKVYNGAEELPSSAYQAYTGTAGQTLHPGFAYVKIAEAYRKNDDDTYAEINVEVVGLKLGNHTEEECRNGARFLYWFLKTPSSGVGGWGCGIDESEIDTASFTSAISKVDLMGLKLDGVMWLRQSAQSWIDQICQAIHGSYSIGANGKRKLFIDYAGAASKKTFNANKIILNKYGKDSYANTVFNKGILSYGYNSITGLFMQSAQFEDSASIAQIGEQKFVGESYLINDAATALAVLEYTCKRSLSSAEAVDFTTDDLTTDLFAGDIITIDRTDLGISGEFQITSISTSDVKSEITAVRFDRSVFTVTGSHSNVNWQNEKQITPALTPAQATNLLLSTGFDINPDGTGNPYISGTFTVPEGGWLAAAVQYGIGANPTNYTELALITEGRFKIQPVNVGTVYTVRVRMITATGHSDYISGQITSTGDSIAPTIPTIAVNATDKSVIVQCAIDNPPYDMGGFQIHRKKHSESVYTLIGNVAANRGYASFSDYVDDWVAYDYKAKSYDRSGNLSDFSEVKTVTVTGIQANDIAATALRIPTGSILRLSAKGCTTASIKQTTDASGNPVYGVKDVSGYNHHGQAFGGVSVLDGGEGFSFDGTANSYINITNNMIAALSANLDALTITARVKTTSTADTGYIFIIQRGTYTAADLKLASGKGRCGGRVDNTVGYVGCNTTQNINDGNWHLLTGVLKYSEGKIEIYLDGVLSNTGTLGSSGTFVAPTLCYVSFSNNSFDGSMADLRIYPRALSAIEVKSMYMLPDEGIFGQLNADLIGANVIRASNLVMTEALITNAAQIDQAVVNNLNVSGNATFQAGLNNIQVGGRNLLKRSSNWFFSDSDYPSNISREYGKLTVLNDNNWDSYVFVQGNISVGISELVKHKPFTYSIEVKTTGLTSSMDNKIYVAASFRGGTRKNYGYNNYLRSANDGKWVKYSYTSASDHPDNNTSLLLDIGTSGRTGFNGLVIEYRNIKLEYGNKATDWTPAPEDVEASIANGDSSTLASAKTYAEGKASTAQSNAEAAAAAALAAVTNNIYYTGTTKIDGGVIQTGSIGAAAIAANSITAERISVNSLSEPRQCKLHWSASQYEGNSQMIPDSSNNNHPAKGNASFSLDNSNPDIGAYFNFVPSSSRFFDSNYAPMPANGSIKSVTLSAWVAINKPPAYDQVRTLYIGQGASYCGWGLSIFNQQLYVEIRPNSSVGVYGVAIPYSWATWAHIVCRINTVGNTIKAYQNGKLVGSASYTSATLGPYSNFRAGWPNMIGGSGSPSISQAFRFADIRVYERALSDEEIMTLYKLGTDTESGQITADRIATDAIVSRDVNGGGNAAFTTNGMRINLAGNGYISSPKFYIDSSGNANYKGALSAGSVVTINPLTSAGANYTATTTSTNKYLLVRVGAIASSADKSFNVKITGSGGFGELELSALTGSNGSWMVGLAGAINLSARYNGHNAPTCYTYKDSTYIYFVISCVGTFTVTEVNGSVNNLAVSVASSITTANISNTNDCNGQADYVIKYVTNITTGSKYRKWRSGLIEQWGKITSSSGSNMTVSLPTAFSDTDYVLIVAPHVGGNMSITGLNMGYAKSTTTFTLLPITSGYAGDFYAYGF